MFGNMNINTGEITTVAKVLIQSATKPSTFLTILQIDTEFSPKLNPRLMKSQIKIQF